jgi:deoxyribodipyrimidine photo-lyase
MPNLVWFRNDLRINDNPALSSAIGDSSESVIGLFLICPKTWLKHNWGSPRVQFLMKNVNEHSRQLTLLNIPLLIREIDKFESVPDLIARLVSEHNCSHVYAGREFGVDEINRDKKVKESLLKSGIKLSSGLS